MTSPMIFYAGGGTGGHIYPNLAIHEKLTQIKREARCRFLVSNRPVDQQIMASQKLQYTALEARPVSLHPVKLYRFYKAFQASKKQVAALIAEHEPVAMVTTGGFVSAPAAAAAAEAKVPVLMVNLDAVPGKANQWITKRATEIFTVYPHPLLATANLIGLPLRDSAVGPKDRRLALASLGMDAHRPMLLVTGASLGATSINDLMIELSQQATPRRAMQEWQILHLAGRQDEQRVREAYEKAGVDAKVMAFCDQMGMAWRGATVAISRCGAGSVAEVWANAVPTIFLPYPYHRDEHQRLNAQMLVDAGASVMLTDLVDPLANARQVGGLLLELMRNEARREQMIAIMEHDQPEPGARAVASWLAKMG